ncbi:MAG: UDP-2,3-diacylglucosamine diphosphatase [Gammaproteobacteria bacterium]
MRALFVSDIHLDPNETAIAEVFLKFLAARTGDADALYILGDLFEAWLGDDAITPFEQEIIDALSVCSQSGTKLYFMHGNRDFLIRDHFSKLSHCTIINDPTLLNLNGIPTLLMHGDTLCSDDVEYQAFRDKLRQPGFMQELLALPVARRTEIAQQYRTISKEETGKKTDVIMDVNDETVKAMMNRFGAIRLIHGHTHRPGSHHVKLNACYGQRLVLGAWHQAGNFIECDQEGCRPKAFPDSDYC